MNPYVSRCLTNPGSDLKQPQAQGINLSFLELRALHTLSEPMNHTIAQTAERKPKGVGYEVMTAQSFGSEAELKLFDPVLAAATLVVESEEGPTQTSHVGDHESQVLSLAVMLGLNQYPSGSLPASSTVAETGKPLLTSACLLIAPLDHISGGFSPSLQDFV
jgi:hypothetical protein